MKIPGLILPAILLATGLPVRADEVKYLLCAFKHGAIKVDINYTAGTVNGVTAVINDKEIIWAPPGKDTGLAVINRYTGALQLSRGTQEIAGICKQMIPKTPK